ncbi:MAG: hypothetical protein M1831_000973 [Alyxoria varia]|nr:MAG: hypothetical protein M1831_000973 [Alyxoria varia]
MSGYEEEHNIEHSVAQQPAQQSRRPDLSTFFSTLELINTSGSSDRSHNNAHAEPMPADVSAAFRQLANSYQVILGETEGVIPGAEAEQPHGRIQNPLLESLIEQLMQGADDPPRRPEGMPDSYFDELERVPKLALRKNDSCPICSNPFLDDKYPLVVRLPCHKDHLFDLDCIRPWLKLNTTCPMDRQDLSRKKKPPTPPPQDDEEGEYDDMYA